MDNFVFATSSGVRPWMGAMTSFTVNEAWRADDPFVKAHPDLFSAAPARVRGTVPTPVDERIERATRRPGERRG